jgi:hypothetical protein
MVETHLSINESCAGEQGVWGTAPAPFTRAKIRGGLDTGPLGARDRRKKPSRPAEGPPPHVGDKITCPSFDCSAKQRFRFGCQCQKFRAA